MNKKNISLLLGVITILLVVTAFFAYRFFVPTQQEIIPQKTQYPPKKISATSNSILVYKAEPEDSFLSGSVTSASDNGSAQSLRFRKIRSNDFGYDNERAKFKNLIARFATKTEVSVSINFPQAPSFAEVRSPTNIVPSSISGTTVNFTLPHGQENYTLKTNIDLSPEGDFIDTVLFWVDDLNNLVLTQPPGAKLVNPSDSLKETVENASAGDTIYISAGTHNVGTVAIDGKQGVSIILHPDAIIKQTSEDEQLFEIGEGSSNITIKGPGEIQAAKDNPRIVMAIDGATNLKFEDFFLYKVHHRDGWTLHIYRSANVSVKGLRIISGNDGTDPDSSTNVTYTNTFIEAQDDAVAVKTRGGVADGIIFQNGFAKSAASALKIGEATIAHLTTNITFVDSTVFDSDRALVVMPRGDGKIGNVLYKNIIVKGMKRDDNGLTIRVLPSASNTGPQVFDGSNIVFDNIDAELIEPAKIEENVTIKHSIFRTNRSLNIFSGKCPQLTNLTIVGGGITTCEVQTEPSYTPTPQATPPSASVTPSPTVTPIVSSSQTPAPSNTPTLTKTMTPTPSPSTTPSQTPTASRTPSPSPSKTPSSTVTPTLTPPQKAACDISCGTCGWRDTAGKCHPTGPIAGTGTSCCYTTCIAEACKQVSGYGTDACTLGKSCQASAARQSNGPNAGVQTDSSTAAIGNITPAVTIIYITATPNPNTSSTLKSDSPQAVISATAITPKVTVQTANTASTPPVSGNTNWTIIIAISVVLLGFGLIM